MLQQIHEEYQNLCMGRGYFVQSSWKVLEISGKDRVRFLHNLLSQNIDSQAIGERSWSCLLNAKGRLIGFFQVWKLADRILLIVKESQKEKIFSTLDMYLITEDVSFKWLDDFSVVSTFVPSKEKLLEGYPYTTNQIIEENILRCSVDDFFIPSVLMLVTQDQKSNLSKLTEISKNLYESTRIQSGFPIHSVDYDDPIPIEVPFMHRAISFTKGCYVGQEPIARLHARGMNVSKKLLGFSCAVESSVASLDVVMLEGEEVGKITSVGFSPIQNKKIGLAWVHRKAFGKSVMANHQNIEVNYE